MRLVLVIFAVTISGCRCGPLDEGTCNGTWGGTTLTNATLDPSSRMVIVNRATCSDADVHVYALSWGNGALATNFSLATNQPTVLTEKQYPLPPTGFLTFSVSPTPPEPEGTLTLGIRGLAGDRTGTLLLKNATEEMTCTFAVSSDTEGQRVSCGGGGDGD